MQPSHVDAILDDMDEYTHIVFPDEHAVALFFQKISKIENKIIIAIGKKTAAFLEKYGHSPTHVVDSLSFLKTLHLDNAYLLLIKEPFSFLCTQGIRHQVW